MDVDETDVGGDITIARREFQKSNGNQPLDKIQSENSVVSNDPEKTSSCEPTALEGRFTTVDAMCIIAGMVMYIADLVTDLVVGVKYLRQGHILWSTMTFVFVLLPTMVLQYFSLRWFVSDLEKDQKHKSKGSLGRIWSWCQWLATHILQFGAIKRYWHTLQYGLLSRKDSAYYQEMVFERVDITMLRLLESFMESAPQLVLQVYIMVTSDEFYWLTAGSAIVSLSSLAFALGAYHKALRDSRPDKLNMSYCGMALRVIWRLFTITARVIALALFASIYKWWVFVLAGVHWAIMTAWLIWQKTEFHGTSCDEVPFDAVIGVVHIFCFFNMKEGCSRYRALAFYSVIFMENTLMFVLWYCQRESREKLYGLPALVFVWGGFFVGLLLMSFYYRFCHPTGKLPLCLSGGEEVDEKPPIGDSLIKDTTVEGSLSNEICPEDEIDKVKKVNGIDEVDMREEVNVIDRRDKQKGNAVDKVNGGDMVDEVNNLTDKVIVEKDINSRVDEIRAVSVEKGKDKGTVMTSLNAACELSMVDEVIEVEDGVDKRNVVDEVNVVDKGNPVDKVNVVDEINVVGKVNGLDEVNVVDEVKVVGKVKVLGKVNVVDEVKVVGKVKVLGKVNVVDEVNVVRKVKVVGKLNVLDEGNVEDEENGVDEVNVLHKVNIVDEANVVDKVIVADKFNLGKVNGVDEVNVVDELNVVDEVNMANEINGLDEENVADEENVVGEVHLVDEVTMVDDIVRTDTNGGDRFECSTVNHNGIKHNAGAILSRSRSFLERDRYQYIFSKKWRRRNSLL